MLTRLFSKRITLSVVLALALLMPVWLRAQICNEYVLVPDSVGVNVLTNFEVQESSGGISPPTLWVCDWIDFEGNGSQECTGIPSCQYTFSTGGQIPVFYQINEPFMGNTAVCTTLVFVNDCSAPVLNAKANNFEDTLWVCTGDAIQLSANPTGGQSCPGVWEYSWYNGNTYFTGTEFNSFTQVWNSAFQNATFDDIITNRTFEVKARCTTYPGCVNTDTVRALLKTSMQTPAFVQSLPTERCAGIDTLYVDVAALGADSIIYSIDALSIAAGNIINSQTGVLIFDSLYDGSTTIKVISYGCPDPDTLTHQIITYPLPNAAFVSDTSYACLGSTIDVVLVTSFQQPPAIISYSVDGFQNIFFNLMDTLPLSHQVDSTYSIYHLTEISDANCTRSLNDYHIVLADSMPLYLPLIDTILCAQDSITLDLGAGAYQYFWWHDNSTASSVLLDTSLTQINTGLNTLYVNISNVYCTVTDTVNVTFSLCTSVPGLPTIDGFLEIYPNPSGGDVFLRMDNLPQGNINASLYDNIGRLCKTWGPLDFEGSILHFNVETSGIYFLKVDCSPYNPIVKKINIVRP